MILWDEMTDLSWPLAEAEVEIPESGFDPGRLRSVSGRYLDTDLGSGDWVIAPDDLGYKGLICILGTYEDPEYAGSTYAYKFILRPWGTDWSDVAEEYPDSLPYYYETWYLPAIEAGIPMPDVIGGGDFSAPGEVPDEEMEGQG
ncbi:MAG TPA: hypothetical protein DGX96_11445 [Lachnospiraceae bacterium]|nr:hypothetical protein [Lachnospiraceae bacterium]